MKYISVFTLAAILMIMGCAGNTNTKTTDMDSMKNKNNPAYSRTDTAKVVLADDEWKKVLAPEVYHVARQKGTERPGTSIFEHSKEVGTYYCAVCVNALFKSDTKFESGSGWPSFWQPLAGAVKTETDVSHGMRRTEVLCSKCGGHLGHVFEDGPAPTGLRYCMNGAAMEFEEKA